MKRFRWSDVRAFGAVVVMIAGAASANDLVVKLPEGVSVRTATATATELKMETAGVVTGDVVRFAKVLPDTPYDVKLTLADGSVLQGVSLDWYDVNEPAKPNAGEFTDDDRQQVQQILDVPSFYDKTEILRLRGDHDRAVLLVQLVRGKAFHSDKGGEVIWRVELWYFENEHGGWAKVAQQNKVLRRERFGSSAAFEQAVARTKWAAALGGIVVPKDRGTLTVTLPAEALTPQPGDSPAAATKPSP